MITNANTELKRTLGYCATKTINQSSAIVVLNVFSIVRQSQ
jgi:hypothetical protein